MDTFPDREESIMKNTNIIQTEGGRMMDYDRNIHHNPDAQAWAKFFIETTKDMGREVFSDEGYMIAWFSNAMMAMHDSMAEKEDLERKYRIAIGYISTMPEFSDKHPLEVAAHFDAIGAASR
jgi:hypothetical protein